MNTITVRTLAAMASLAWLASPAISQTPAAATIHYIQGPRADAPLPRPVMTLKPGRVALVVTDPQNDFLHPKGVAWGVVGKSVTENRTIENLESLFQIAKAAAIPVFISPHYYYQQDHQWKFEGALGSVAR